jgi:hypothetical protein
MSLLSGPLLPAREVERHSERMAAGFATGTSGSPVCYSPTVSFRTIMNRHIPVAFTNPKLGARDQEVTRLIFV